MDDQVEPTALSAYIAGANVSLASKSLLFLTVAPDGSLAELVGGTLVGSRSCLSWKQHAVKFSFSEHQNLFLALWSYRLPAKSSIGLAWTAVHMALILRSGEL